MNNHLKMSLSTPLEKNETLTIEQDNKKYKLNIKIQGEKMTLVLSALEEIGNITFIKTMELKDIKEIHGYFSGINSCNQFCNYLKGLLENNKLSITKKEGNLSLNFTVDYLFEKQSIELILLPQKKNNDELITALCAEINSLKEKVKNLENKDKEKIDNLQNENKELINIINGLKNEIHNLKEEMKEIKDMKEQIKETNKLIEPIDNMLKEININRYTKFNEKSVIMKENDYNFITSVIKFRINKEIKEIKKLYQATVHGDSAKNFHMKCDDIPNTLVVIKSAGYKRFGGFTTKKWSSPDNYEGECDKNAFLFSLDKQKIYDYKGKENYAYHENKKYAIYKQKGCGPVFGGTQIYQGNFNYNFSICICSGCIHYKSSYTNESDSDSNYDFNKDNNALSEDGKKGNIFISEYEVFQIIFA